jgi:poly(glycerol-phosphate) alpha-glucosyltransferase
MLDPWAVRNSAWKKRIAHAFYEGAHLRETACIRALCESEARAIRNFGLKNPIAIIPNGIDLENVDGSQTKGAPWAEVVEGGKRVLLFLGRIHPKKGLVNLLKAWGASQSPQQSNAKAAEWVLAIAGWDQGGHEAELKRICTGLGIAWADMRAAGAPEPGFSDRLGSLPSGGSNSSPGSAGQPSVVFLGPQFSEAKALCYAKCDAFILPSFSEGLPMVILEAWAHRKPVLMTPECNLPEGVAANAAICFETDVENVLGGLRSLFEMTDEERLEMGVRGHELASKRFDWDQIAHETKVLYEWVLGGGQKPDCLWEDSV